MSIEFEEECTDYIQFRERKYLRTLFREKKRFETLCLTRHIGIVNELIAIELERLNPKDMYGHLKESLEDKEEGGMKGVWSGDPDDLEPA